MPMSGEIVFVLADTRSGSTLVDQLLGAHPSIVSLGELHWLTAYVRQDRDLYDPAHPLICNCGHTVPDCPFWREVAAKLGKPLDSLQLRPRFFPWTSKERQVNRLAGHLRSIPKRLIQRLPGAYRYSLVQRVFLGQRLAVDSIALFDAILEVTGSQYLVDSSKQSFRFRSIYEMQPDRTRAIVLARDYRAVVHSKMKRGRSLEDSAIGWRMAMNRIQAQTEDIPESRKYRLKYEALCENPQRELTRICGFLGVKFTPEMLRRPTKGVHHIGGSPSKFDSSRISISLDSSYESAFSSEQLVRLRHLVGTMADDWGYSD